VTETIFSWPGLGPALINGLGGADLDLVLAIVFFIGVVTVFFNLVADVMYGVLDPRIRLD
jgi:peptide/nickel transport system permease protein